MKSQVPIISAVLIFGIVAALIVSAYLWGMPILAKTSDAAQYEFAKKAFFEINDAILETARTCGQRSVNFRIERGRLRVLGSENLLEYSFSTRVPLITTQEWVILNEDDPFVAVMNDTGYPGIVGEDSPGIIYTRAFGWEEYLVKIRLKYRRLEEKGPYPQPRHLINLTTSEEVGIGTHTLVMECLKKETLPGKSKIGSDLIVTYVSVSLK